VGARDMSHKMHPSPAFMTTGVTAVPFLCGLFRASASAFVRSKGVAGERERENCGLEDALRG
jgi:hypothetical protein